MNKFTLRFQHPDLEEDYQNTRLQVRKQVFYGMAMSYLIMNSMSVIMKTISDTKVLWYMDATIISIAMSTIALVTYKNKYICQGLCVMNFIASLIQIELSETNTNQVTYIFGANIMGTQLMLLIGCDFLFSLVQLVIIISLRLAILASYYPLDWFSVALTLIVSFWLGVYQYQSDQNLRIQFLLRLKENHWDQSLPSMIGRPFLYFEYDTQFHVKTAFRENEILTYNSEFCNSCNLRIFLREFKYDNQTLETFILDRVKKRQKPFKGLEIISFNKKNVKISFTYSEMFSDSNTFVIIFNPQPKKVNLVKENYTSFRKLLLAYTSYLVKILATRKSFGRKAIEVNVHFLSALYIRDFTIIKYKPADLLKQIAKLFNLQVYATFQDQIYGYKNLFTIFWIEMMTMIGQSQHSLQQPHIYVTADKTQLLFILSLESPSKFNYLYQRNKVVQKLKKHLFFEINEQRWMFKIYIDLDVTFNSYYLQQ